VADLVVLTAAGGHKVVKLAEAVGHWDPSLHPRDHNGQFIKKGSIVLLPNGTHGQVVGVSKGLGGKPKLEVDTSSGGVVYPDAKKVTVTAQPKFNPGDKVSIGPSGNLTGTVSGSETIKPGTTIVKVDLPDGTQTSVLDTELDHAPDAPAAPDPADQPPELTDVLHDSLAGQVQAGDTVLLKNGKSAEVVAVDPVEKIVDLKDPADGSTWSVGLETVDKKIEPAAPTYKIGDKVLYGKAPATVSEITNGLIQVKLDNGHYTWVNDPKNLTPAPAASAKSPMADLYDKLTKDKPGGLKTGDAVEVTTPDGKKVHGTITTVSTDGTAYFVKTANPSDGGWLPAEKLTKAPDVVPSDPAAAQEALDGLDGITEGDTVTLPSGLTGKVVAAYPSGLLTVEDPDGHTHVVGAQIVTKLDTTATVANAPDLTTPPTGMFNPPAKGTKVKANINGKIVTGTVTDVSPEGIGLAYVVSDDGDSFGWVGKKDLEAIGAPDTPDTAPDLTTPPKGVDTLPPVGTTVKINYYDGVTTGKITQLSPEDGLAYVEGPTGGQLGWIGKADMEVVGDAPSGDALPPWIDPPVKDASGFDLTVGDSVNPVLMSGPKGTVTKIVPDGSQVSTSINSPVPAVQVKSADDGHLQWVEADMVYKSAASANAAGPSYVASDDKKVYEGQTIWDKKGYKYVVQQIDLTSDTATATAQNGPKVGETKTFPLAKFIAATQTTDPNGPDTPEGITPPVTGGDATDAALHPTWDASIPVADTAGNPLAVGDTVYIPSIDRKAVVVGNLPPDYAGETPRLVVQDPDTKENHVVPAFGSEKVTDPKLLYGQEAEDSLPQVKVPPTQEEALDDYTGSGYSQINTELRNYQGDLEELKRDEGTYVPTKVKRLDALIKKSTIKQPIEVYRGMHHVHPGDITTGTTFRDWGFISTTTDRNTAQEFGSSVLFQLQLDPGTHALSIDNNGGGAQGGGEDEILLPRGQAFYTTNVIKLNGRTIIQAKAVDTPTGPVLASAAMSLFESESDQPTEPQEKTPMERYAERLIWDPADVEIVSQPESEQPEVYSGGTVHLVGGTPVLVTEFGVVRKIGRAFDEALHPRDRNGRFITKGADVRLGDGSTGHVTSTKPLKNGKAAITVKRDNGTSVVVNPNKITVRPPMPGQMGKVRMVQSNPNVPSADLMKSIKDNGGFTYDPRTGGLLVPGKDQGIAVAVPGTEQIVGNGEVSRQQFAKGVQKVLMAHRTEIADGAKLGGWYSEDRNAYMVELTDVLPGDDREAAIAEGKKRNQEGIFDIGANEFIPTGGTGDATPDAPSAPDANPPNAPDAPDANPANAPPAPDLDKPGNAERFSPEARRAQERQVIENAKSKAAAPAAAPGAEPPDPWADPSTYTPEQQRAYDMAGDVVAKYSAIEPQVTSQLTDVTAGLPGGAKLEGLQYKLKGQTSLARKLHDKSPGKNTDLPPEQRMDAYRDQIGDALRYTQVSDEANVAANAQATLAALQQRGWTVKEVGNTWTPGSAYKGINTNLTTPDGQHTFELQFHTPQSLAVKETNHKLYDVARLAQTPDAEKERLNAQMSTNAGEVPQPPGIESVAMPSTQAANVNPLAGGVNTASPVGKDFRNMTPSQKIAAVAMMYGTNSKQYQQALKKWAKAA
jgi:preprotein translocase subunit YajC/co-chaperonin GroES (HSP10)